MCMYLLDIPLFSDFAHGQTQAQSKDTLKRVKMDVRALKRVKMDVGSPKERISWGIALYFRVAKGGYLLEVVLH